MKLTNKFFTYTVKPEQMTEILDPLCITIESKLILDMPARFGDVRQSIDMSLEEAERLVSSLQSAIERMKSQPGQDELAPVELPPPPAEKRRVSVAFSAYNARRYWKPWIARVTAWPVGGKPTLEFGSYVGDSGGGEAEIMARPGELIRYGQSDGRGNHGTNEWAVVEADYAIRELTQVEARKLFEVRA